MSVSTSAPGGRMKINPVSQVAGKQQNFVVRDYQVELLHKAREKNIIVCLGTGTGKTFVSVLLIKELLYQTQDHCGKKKTVFLAPTVPLVKQQAAVINTFVDAEIGCYFGGEIIDSWGKSEWRREIEKNNVLVMVPQLLSNILNQYYMSLEEINLIIFDECHAATGNHCYVQVMQNHYVKTEVGKRPRILGLTASVLNKKAKATQVESQLRELCHRLDATLATSLSSHDFSTRPSEIAVLYKESPAVKKFANMASPPLGTFSGQMNSLLTEVGPYGALKSLEHRRKCTQHRLDVGLAEETSLGKLQELLREINSAHRSVEGCFNQIREGKIPNPYKVLRSQYSSGYSTGDDLEIYVPPKVERLLDVLETFRKSERDLCCVIFAQERYTVFALWCLLAALSRKNPQRFDFIRPGFVMGAQNSSFKSEEEKIIGFSDERFDDEGSTLDNFRTGALNVLVATSVIEEGVDIPQCNLIVKMSEILNLKSYVQCRGRARAKPSIYAFLTSDTNRNKVMEEIEDFKKAENIIMAYCEDHDMDTISSADVEFALPEDPDLPTLYAKPDDPKNSAIITKQSARSVLQQYCDTLGNDRYQVLRPRILYQSRPSVAVGFEQKKCTIVLPKASKLFPEEVSGDWLANKTKARISAALKTCKRLYDLNELTENLTPRKRPKPTAYVWTDDQVSDEVKELFDGNTIQQQSSISSARAMSRELKSMSHPILPAKATLYVFRSRLDVPLNDEHSHLRTFKPEAEGLCFGLLTFTPNCSTNIPDFPIFTRNGREVVRTDTITDVIVTEDIWDMCSKFHSYIMKTVCRISDSEFDPLSAPVYVPVRSQTIDRELLNRVFSNRKNGINLSSVVTCRATRQGENRSFFVRELLDTNQGRKLSLEKIPKNLDYSRNSFREQTKFKEVTSDERRADFAVFLVNCEEELLSAAQWSKARTMPICTHRLNRLLIAEQYRQDIVGAGIGHNGQQRWPPMLEDSHNEARDAQPRVKSAELKFISEVENSPGPSPTDILTALTPLSAQDIIDSERFEVLGDSFLKIAITLHLFPQPDMSDEGKLTAERCRLISNMNLLSLAVPKKLHEAVESRKFSIKESFRPPGVILTGDEEQRLQRQKYKSKICADSVEAMIGVYLAKSGPIGALQFLRYLGLRLGSRESGPFLSRFDLRYNPVVWGNSESVEKALTKHTAVMTRVERILGYEFKNRLYLLEALTHPTYQYNGVTRSYERLEFLGDAVIDYLVSCFIFTNNPHLNPGQMTSVRSALVCNNQFAKIVTQAKLANALLHLSPLLFRVTARYTKIIEGGQSPELLIGENETENGDDIDVPKPFGDLMESLIGAVFIDSGLDFAKSWDVFRGLITDEVLVETLKHNPRNPIQVLEELSQKTHKTKCQYGDVIVRDDKLIEMTLDVGGHRFRTVARNKKTAKLTLAKMALRKLRTEIDAANSRSSVLERLAQELDLGRMASGIP